MNKLTFKILRSEGRGQGRVLFVDGHPLLDLIERAIPKAVAHRWREKADARVDSRQLKRTLRRSGEFDLLVCAECDMPEDICMFEPFLVTRTESEVAWRIAPPGSGEEYEEFDRLELRFDRDEYDQVIRAFLQRDAGASASR